MLPIWLGVVIGVVCLLAGVLVCFPLGVQYRKRIAEKEITSAEEEA